MIKMARYSYAFQGFDATKHVRASIREKKISHKHARETAKAIKGLTLEKARDYMLSVIAKERAKSRIKQTLIAIPFIGSVVFAAVEINDFKSWQKENPKKTKGDYACETAKASIEVINDLMDNIPTFAKKNVSDSITSIRDNCSNGLE